MSAPFLLDMQFFSISYLSSVQPPTAYINYHKIIYPPFRQIPDWKYREPNSLGG